MWQEMSIAGGEFGCGRVELQSMWHVKADSSYDVLVGERPEPVVVVRTYGGMGECTMVDGEVLVLGGDTLAVLEIERLRRYRCVGDRWDFWWFACDVEGVMPLPKAVVLQVPPLRDEGGVFKEMLRLLRSDVSEERALASVQLLRFLYEWRVKLSGVERRSPYAEAVRRVIDGMHARIDGLWPVSEMALEARLGERRFRQVFEEETGCSPKSYYDRIRMDYATELLRLGCYSVAEVSCQLGFSNPFNFSRAFRRVKGFPPSSLNNS